MKENTHLLARGFVTGKAFQVHKAELVKDCDLKAIPCKKWGKKYQHFVARPFLFFNKLSLRWEILSIYIFLPVSQHLLPRSPSLSLQVSGVVKMFLCLSPSLLSVCHFEEGCFSDPCGICILTHTFHNPTLSSQCLITVF